MPTNTYNGYTFSTKSEAQELFAAKKFEELGTHLKKVSEDAKKLQGDPTKAIRACRALIIKNYLKTVLRDLPKFLLEEGVTPTIAPIGGHVVTKVEYDRLMWRWQLLEKSKQQTGEKLPYIMVDSDGWLKEKISQHSEYGDGPKDFFNTWVSPELKVDQGTTYLFSEVAAEDAAIEKTLKDASNILLQRKNQFPTGCNHEDLPFQIAMAQEFLTTEKGHECLGLGIRAMRFDDLTEEEKQERVGLYLTKFPLNERPLEAVHVKPEDAEGDFKKIRIAGICGFGTDGKELIIFKTTLAKALVAGKDVPTEVVTYGAQSCDHRNGYIRKLLRKNWHLNCTFALTTSIDFDTGDFCLDNIKLQYVGRMSKKLKKIFDKLDFAGYKLSKCDATTISNRPGRGLITPEMHFV